ncbi:UNVERIFIED_CONTAM: hypothetical protein Slati_0136300 [Sesamum latifolium]|uniref:Integrase catalytic domain-containing protein n=1 Tax=Sesamum latifolium TaxID=2727402 RepID=A0AAW2YAN4_9LAMI
MVTIKTPTIDEVVINMVIEGESWKTPFIQYLKSGVLPSDPILAKQIQFKANRFVLIAEELFKRIPEGMLLKCLDKERVEYVMREIHGGSCGNHSGGRSLAQKITRRGYFWPTMVADAMEFSKKCESCQRFANLLHAPATPLEGIKIACPFDQWGIDIVGPFPLALAQKKFMIVAIEYFSKWVEAEAVAKISEKEVMNFIWKNIVCRFRVPRILISDNGAQFQGKKIVTWCKELKIQQHFTAVGNPQANVQTEVTNRILLQHLKTSATGETPFCLVYGSEAIIPAEIGEETARVSQYEPADNGEKRSFDLSTIEEKRDRAYARILHYKKMMTRGYNQKVKPRSFQVDDLVLKKVEVSKHVGKLDPTWEGPYKVTEIKKRGIYALQDLEGKNLPQPWNIHNLKKFYA